MLGKVGDIPVVKKTDMGYILKNGCLIEDTFAEMFPTLEISPVNPLNIDITLSFSFVFVMGSISYYCSYYSVY